MKLAIAQMVLGVLILVNWLMSIVWWRVPTWPEHALLEGVVLTASQTSVPWFTVFLVLGLTVLGCGIAQYLKARG